MAGIAVWYIRRCVTAMRRREGERLALSARTESFRLHEERVEAERRDAAELMRRIQAAHDVPVGRVKEKAARLKRKAKKK